MTVCLIFPPPWDTSQPYLSTAALAQHLKANSIDVIQWDLNLRFVQYLCEPRHFAFATQKLQDVASSAPDESTREAASWQLKIASSLEQRLSLFDDTMRSQTLFYDPQAYFRAQRLINKIYDFWSAAYAPTQMTPISFRANLQGNHVEVAREYATDEDCNPIIRFMSQSCNESSQLNQPDLLFGISIIYDDQIVPALTMSKFLKRRFPRSKVILGGGAISQYARVFRESLFDFDLDFDFVVIDDGYDSLTSIARALHANEPVQDENNLLIKGRANNIRIVPPISSSSWAPPNPDFAGLPLGEYHSPEPMLSFKASKGCKWGKCTFCSESAFKEYAPADAGDVVDTIARYAEVYDLRFVNFADSDISPARFIELSSELLRRKLNIGWSIRARLDLSFDHDTLTLGAEAGCRKIFFGLESASQRLLKLMKKGISINNVPEILSNCTKNGILTHLFTFVGFPTESADEAQMTRDFILNNIFAISSFNVGVFQLRRFSDAFNTKDSLGVKTEEGTGLFRFVDSLEYSNAVGITHADAIALQQQFLRFFKGEFAQRGLPYEINKWSGYVNLKGVPYWDCHNLAYADFAVSVMAGAGRKLHTNRVRVAEAKFVVLRQDPRSTTLYFPEEFRTISMSHQCFAQYRRIIGKSVDYLEAPWTSELVSMGLATAIQQQ
jgi:anaerobic magnesium-protoporphyrin IX monomethyl ester cyclase